MPSKPSLTLTERYEIGKRILALPAHEHAAAIKAEVRPGCQRPAVRHCVKLARLFDAAQRKKLIAWEMDWSTIVTSLATEDAKERWEFLTKAHSENWSYKQAKNAHSAQFGKKSGYAGRPAMHGTLESDLDSLNAKLVRMLPRLEVIPRSASFVEAAKALRATVTQLIEKLDVGIASARKQKTPSRPKSRPGN